MVSNSSLNLTGNMEDIPKKKNYISCLNIKFWPKEQELWDLIVARSNAHDLPINTVIKQLMSERMDKIISNELPH